MLGFRGVKANEADPLLVLQDEGVTFDDSADGSVLSLTFFKRID